MTDCAHCGAGFTASKRKNGAPQRQQFCSTSCRKQNWRLNRPEKAVQRVATPEGSVDTSAAGDACKTLEIRSRGNPPTAWFCGWHWHLTEPAAIRCVEIAKLIPEFALPPGVSHERGPPPEIGVGDELETIQPAECGLSYERTT